MQKEEVNTADNGPQNLANNPENGNGGGGESPFLSSSQSSSSEDENSFPSSVRGQKQTHQANLRRDQVENEFQENIVKQEVEIKNMGGDSIEKSQKADQSWENNNKDDDRNQPQQMSSIDSSSDDDEERHRRGRGNYRRHKRRGSDDSEHDNAGSQDRGATKRGRSRSRSNEDRPRGEGRNKRSGGESSSQSHGSRSGSGERGHKSKSSRYPDGRRSHHREPTRSNYRSSGASRYGSKDSNKITMPSLNRHLYSIQQFSHMQGEHIEYEKMAQAYEEYKSDHEKYHQKIFFKDHQEEAWFLEKYDPQTVYNLRLRQNAHASKLAQKFFAELQVALQNGQNDFSNYLNLEVAPENIASLNEQQTDVTGPPLHGFDPNSMTLYLKNVPVDVSRLELIEIVNGTPGYTSFSMSQPLMTHNYVRYAWISYDSEENCTKAKQMLEDQLVKDQYKLNPVKSVGARKPVRVTPRMPNDYIERDNKLCRKLIEEVLDRERQISPNFNFEMIEKLTTEQQLDVMLVYMRRVHGYCLYSAEQYDDERMLTSKCGSQHVRAPATIPRAEVNDNLEYHETKMFEKRYVKCAEDKIHRGPQLPQNPLEDPWLTELKQEYASEKTKEIQEGKKYQCKICLKNFCGREFVVKHIFNKHEEQLNLKFNQRVFSELLKKNYFADPNNFVNTVPSSSAQGSHFDRNRQRPGNYKPRDAAAELKRKENYIDWDDPNTNVNQMNFMKTTQPAAAQQDQAMQDQSKPTNTVPANRQLVSYDDLF